MMSAGHSLRSLRERLGLTMRDVEEASVRIAERHSNDDYAVVPSRLSDIETKGTVPSMHRLYSLSVIYRCDFRELLALYGINLNETSQDVGSIIPPKSHLMETLQGAAQVRVPVRLDPAFDPRSTTNLGRMVEKWGVVPLAYLAQFGDGKYSYGYVGSEDFTMYPILPPGSFIQIDESRCRVTAGMWRSEYERPIYFVETRTGFVCCWCSVAKDTIMLQPHPLSPVQMRVLRHPQEAEVVGQVVGVALRLTDWQAIPNAAEPRERAALT
jgi:transcriptional regulator with XRE-family HTH domain